MPNWSFFKRSLCFLIFFQVASTLYVQDAVFGQDSGEARQQAMCEQPVQDSGDASVQEAGHCKDSFQDSNKTPDVPRPAEAQDILADKTTIITEEELNELTMARLLDESNLYKYLAMNIEFYPQHKQARWVGYFISRERLEGEHFKRKGIAFVSDGQIKGGSACDADYRKSGYDRGHLAPARDMAFSKETLTQSFLFSNISPQKPKFNRGKWAELENYAREQAMKRDVIVVITGPIFSDEIDESIGRNKVSVPHAFFKALLFYSKERVEAIGFVMPNDKLKEELETYACSVDYMEEIANIDVFPALSDEVEEASEASVNWDFWFGD